MSNKPVATHDVRASLSQSQLDSHLQVKTILQDLQNQIENLHGIQIGIDVAAFCIDDAMRQQIPGAIDGLVEQLFVRQFEQSIEMALYIDPRILEALRRDPPSKRLHFGNVENFCIALEGISHFVFLAWRAHINRPVTALEMEIQAEVDKFMCGLLLLKQQLPSDIPVAWLMEILFAKFLLRPEVPDSEQERYVIAHRVAYQFSQMLLAQSMRQGLHLSIPMARAFFRMGLADKLQIVSRPSLSQAFP